MSIISVATSTLGMAAYNALAIQPRVMDFKDIVFATTQMMHHDVDAKQMQAALDRLVELGRIKSPDDKGRYELVAGEALLVVQRDRSDYNHETGEGGWGGWRVKDPRIRDGVGTRPLEHLIGQATADISPRPSEATP